MISIASFGPPILLKKNCPRSCIVGIVLSAWMCLRGRSEPGFQASVNLEMCHTLNMVRSAVMKSEV